MQNIVFYIILMMVAGIGVPTMASLNAGLSGKLQNPILAVVILICVALVVATSILLFTSGVPTTLYVEGTPKYMYLAGFLFVLYIFSATWVIPKFGVANAISFVLLGQLIAMSTIDHFGLFGLEKYEMTWQRFSGLVVMAIGIFLVLSKSSK